MRDSKTKAMAGPRPVVLSGPSGAGKSTLLKKLMQEYDSVFGFSVSRYNILQNLTRNSHLAPASDPCIHGDSCSWMYFASLLLFLDSFNYRINKDTTRNPRPGEQDGKDYHFVTREAMQAGIDNGEFIESAEFSGNMYGTSKAAVQAVQAKNLICILDIDMQGVKNIKMTDLNPLYISIQPPSIDVLENRLRDRKTESEESLQRRLQIATVDMELSKEPGMFDVQIVNDNLEDAYGQLKLALLEEINVVKKVNMSS